MKLNVSIPITMHEGFESSYEKVTNYKKLEIEFTTEDLMYLKENNPSSFMSIMRMIDELAENIGE